MDRLTNDVVTRELFHTYLTRYGTPTRRATAPPARKSETIQRLKSRLVAVVRRALVDLRNADRLLLADGGCEDEDGELLTGTDNAPGQ